MFYIFTNKILFKSKSSVQIILFSYISRESLACSNRLCIHKSKNGYQVHISYVSLGFCTGQPGRLNQNMGVRNSKIICGAATNLQDYLIDKHERD